MHECDAIARLRVALVTGRLPPDLGRWLLWHVGRSLGRVDRLKRRDAALRAAAGLLEGSEWAKAQAIHELLCTLRDAPELAETEGALSDPAAEHVAQAFLLDRTFPASWRQVHRIIRRGDTSPDGVTIGRRGRTRR